MLDYCLGARHHQHLSQVFWQEGPDYDRKLQTCEAVLASIDYIHLNPVKRGLCQRARDWRWSSARFYESGGTVVDPA
jgi:putative transposase